MSATGSGEEWDLAPCGLATLRVDGTVLAANRTLLGWVGREGQDVVGRVRLSDLLSVGGRIYWETHLAPLLHVDGRVDEVTLELAGPHGRLPVLMTAVASGTGDGTGGVLRVALSSAGERVRYEHELLAARRDAERSAAQVHALQDVTAALSRAPGVEGVVDAVVSAALGSLGAAAGALWLARPDGELQLRRVVGEPAQAAALGVVRLPPSTAETAQGRVVVPLHGQSALQGALALVPRRDAASDPLDLDVLTAVGQQVGLALERAQLYEQSALVAHDLQRALLSGAPPEDPRFAVATTYRPGVERLEVGGDWYDAFLADDGVLAVVVGDVVGRGLGAATAMGQLRSAVRAVAGPGVGPAHLLSRLDRFVDQVPAAGMATLAYAEVDLGTGRVRYACAGNPPPLLLAAGAGARLLWGGRSMPLGAVARTRPRTEAEVVLAPLDRLLLVTDGLFERRDRPLDVGLQVLAAEAAALGAQPLGVAVRSLTERLLQDERHRDDVCVLLVSWAGPPFERHLSADLRELSSMRHALAAWLAVRGVDGDTGYDVVLAASEVVANAVEHGSDGSDGGDAGTRVRVRARVEQHLDSPDDVVLRVQDGGRWRPPAAGGERGRGLTIAAAVVDELVVETGGSREGTTVRMRRGLPGRVA